MNANCSILIVDDEEIVRDSLAGWLEADGYQVETAVDGLAALRQMGQRAYAILLVDLKMPGMDGLQLLMEARSRQPNAVVILMTAYGTVETAVQAMKHGAHDYLMKPIEPEELSRIVSRLTVDLSRRPPASRVSHGTRADGVPASPPTSASSPAQVPLPRTDAGAGDATGSLRENERRHIAISLRRHGWNISRTARALGIDRVTLYNKIKRYEIREGE